MRGRTAAGQFSVLDAFEPRAILGFLNTPSVISYNLEVQQQLPFKIILDIG